MSIFIFYYFIYALDVMHYIKYIDRYLFLTYGDFA